MSAEIIHLKKINKEIMRGWNKSEVVVGMTEVINSEDPSGNGKELGIKYFFVGDMGYHNLIGGKLNVHPKGTSIRLPDDACLDVVDTETDGSKTYYSIDQIRTRRGLTIDVIETELWNVNRGILIRHIPD